MFNTTITDTQQRQIVVSGPGDKRGNPTGGKLDAPPTFASADTTIATFDADPTDATGMTGLLKAVGPLSSAAAVSISAAVGGVAIVENGLVQISAGAATGLAVTVGAATEQA
jgi:hypothetical protein